MMVIADFPVPPAPVMTSLASIAGPVHPGGTVFVPLNRNTDEPILGMSGGRVTYSRAMKGV